MDETQQTLFDSFKSPIIPLPGVQDRAYFSEAERKGLDPLLIFMLEKARHTSGIPFVINCGPRTKEENDAVGGVPDSAHLKGLAVDLRCQSSAERYLMLKALFEAGFRRIEVATAHIHVDLDATKAQNVCWLGVSA